MAAQYDFLETVTRVEIGSKEAKTLRRDGKIPGIFYYKGETNVNLSFDKQSLLKTLHKGGHIFELELEGTKQYAMIKEVQYHPVTDEIIHIDLMRVRRDEKITISVPLVLEGESVGVAEGGVMMQSLSSAEISCLPENVPEQIAFLRLDTDIYEPTIHQLEILYPKLCSGGILHIDDYGHCPGVMKAVDEYFNNKDVWLHRVDYTCRLIIKE